MSQPLPQSGIPMTDLTQETASTLDGTEQFVMFDSSTGKRATLGAVAEVILSKIEIKDPNDDGHVEIVIGGF